MELVLLLADIRVVVRAHKIRALPVDKDISDTKELRLSGVVYSAI